MITAATGLRLPPVEAGAVLSLEIGQWMPFAPVAIQVRAARDSQSFADDHGPMILINGNCVEEDGQLGPAIRILVSRRSVGQP